MFEVDQERFEIRYGKQVLDLTPAEFRLLATLVGHPGRVFNRDQLMNQLYSDHRIVTDRTVDSHIKNLRKKISAYIPDREVIVSIYGIGYKYNFD